MKQTTKSGKNESGLSQAQRIKKALKMLQESDRLKIAVTLDSGKSRIKDSDINIKPLPVLWFNKLIFFGQQWIVPMHFKNWLLRLTGMNVGHFFMTLPK